MKLKSLKQQFTEDLIVALLHGGGLTTDQIHKKVNAIFKVLAKYAPLVGVSPKTNTKCKGCRYGKLKENEFYIF